MAFERHESSIYRCARCAVEFSSPQPTDARLAEIYSSEYFLGSEGPEAARRVTELKRATAGLYLDIIRPLVKAASPKLLEIGCGSGDFLCEAQSRGFEVEGLEYSPHAAAVANARLSRDVVRTGSLEEIALPSNAYDVAAAFDVIEHVRNPGYFLRRLHAALAPGGAVIIVTPSLDSWSRRLLGRYWMEYKTEHLTYFSRKALRHMLEQSGFSDVKFVSNYKVLSIDYVYRHFEKFTVPLLTPVVRLVRRVLPEGIAHRRLKIVASGTMALARKSVTSEATRDGKNGLLHRG